MYRSPWHALALALLPAAALAAPGNDKEHEAALAAATKSQVAGPATVQLRDQAVLRLPAGNIYVPPPAAAQLLQSLGNRTDDRLAGVVVPAADAGWFAVIQVHQEGHVRDDGARDMDPGPMLRSLKAGTEAGNAERERRGIPAIEVVGWAEEPRYDRRNRQLVWSAATRRKGAADSDGTGVNYNTYTLGRQGYISLNMVTGRKELQQNKAAAHALLAAMQYKPGKRYGDFDAASDKVAPFGLAALITGATEPRPEAGALAKDYFDRYGKWAGAGAVLAVALVGGALALRRRRRAQDEEPPVHIEPSLYDSSKPPGPA